MNKRVYYEKELSKIVDRLELYECDETFICNECLEEYCIDFLEESELAKNDMICVYCMRDGYGE